MQIALYHAYYDNNYLEIIKNIMIKKGTPKIRVIWSEVHGIWLAVEGCHRLRAAYNLGLMPTVKDISNQKTVTIQIDGDNKKVNVTDLLQELNDNACKTEILNF